MGTDPSTGDVILFGGFQGGAFLPFVLSDETWVWDGANWSQRLPANRPGPRRWAHLVPRIGGNNRLVMLGGSDPWLNPVQGDEIWEWTGQDWARLSLTPGSAYPTRLMVAAAADPVTGGALAFELESNQKRPQLLWSWDGTAWSASGPAPTATWAEWPANFQWASFCLDQRRGQIVRFGGDAEDLWLTQKNGFPYPFRTTWAFDLMTRKWRIAHDHPWLPITQFGVVHDANRGRTLFVATPPWGYPPQTATWAYRNGRFEQLPTTTTPPRRGFPSALGCHHASGLVVLHGDGSGDNQGQNHDTRTWLFDGVDWVSRQYPVFPDPKQVRYGDAMVYDVANRILLLYLRWSRELWGFDPTGGWRLLATEPSLPHYSRGLAYDVGRARAVLLGDQSPNPVEVWEWDGRRWAKITTSSPLPDGALGKTAYVPELGGVVLVDSYWTYGGGLGTGKTWLWDGASWSTLPVRELPWYRWGNPYSVTYSHVFYDPEARVLNAFYGGDVNMPMFELSAPTLAVDRPFPHPGETMRFTLRDPSQANRLAFLGWSFSRNTGIPVMPHPFGILSRYPLDAGFLLAATLSSLSTSLDAAGTGTFTATIPPMPSLVDVDFHACAITVDQGGIGSISNALDLEIIR